MRSAMSLFGRFMALALALVCSFQTASSISFVSKGSQIPGNGTLLATGKPGVDEAAAVGGWFHTKTSGGVSFVQKNVLKLLKQRYLDLKKSYLKGHTKRQFILLKYEAMIQALREENAKAGQ